MRVIIKLREIRKSKNLTLKQLSLMTGVSISHLNDIENNLKVPSITILVIISIVLKVDIKELYIVKM